jgi:hypothetical protein
MPIWGGNYTLMRARAIENHVFLVSAGYDARRPSSILMRSPVSTKESGAPNRAGRPRPTFSDPWLEICALAFTKKLVDVPIAGLVNV